MRSPVTHGSSACVAARVALVATVTAALIGGGAALAQSTPSDARPYDDKLMRLSEILGAVHYLRELCGANDGQKWRETMKELMDTEGSSALRSACVLTSLRRVSRVSAMPTSTRSRTMESTSRPT